MRIRERIVRACHHPRRGMAAVLFGFLLPAFLGFAALSVDTAILATARSQLSTAADASALAAAQTLASELRVRGTADMSALVAASNTRAAQFAALNKVLNLGVTVLPNTNNTNDGGDVMVGYLTPGASASALVTASASSPLFNSVQVRAMRNADRGGLVPTFFGGLMGFRGSAIAVQSTAMAQNYSVAGFRQVRNLNANLLPIVLDHDTCDLMMARQTTDRYGYDPATKTVSKTPDGIYESVLYPVDANLPGNWGTIKVGVSNNSTSTLGDQIRYGITPAQLATFPGGKIELSTATNPPSIVFEGNPGISAGIKDDLTSIIGKPVMIPIYNGSGGNGNNAWYRVINFVCCRIVDVNFQGNPKYVVIQPALVSDPTAIPGPVMSSWTDGGLIVLHLVR